MTAAEHDAIEKHGLFNLADFLPKKPNEVELKVIKEMFEASVDGEPYDPERWGAYFKPAGFQSDRGAAPAAAAKPAPVAEITEDDIPAFTRAPAPVDDDEPAEASAPVVAANSSGKRAEDILAMIRNRQK